MGVQVKHVVPTADLYRARIHSGDIVTQVNGRSVHTPEQLAQVVSAAAAKRSAASGFLRGEPFHKEKRFSLANNL